MSAAIVEIYEKSNMKRSCPSTLRDGCSGKSPRVSICQSPPLRQTHATPQQFPPAPAHSSPPSPVDVDLRKVMDEFVVIYERLDTLNDPLVKPNYSYTELVYLALLRAPNFCLPINEIYRYIQAKFQFFERNTREHWRNAVRHSLSKTKCFTKIGVRRGPNSSGTYNRSMFLWTFHPSSIVNFARGDYRSNADKESGTNTLRWGYYRINAGEFWDRVAIALETKMATFKQDLSLSSTQAHVFESQVCVISTDTQSLDSPVDATVSLTTTHTHVTSASPALYPASSSPLYTDSCSKTCTGSSSFPAVSSSQVSPCYPGYASPIPGQSAPGYPHHYLKPSHSLRQSSSTPVHSVARKSSSSTARPPKTWESPSEIVCWNPRMKPSPGADSDSDLSWNSCHDSGVGTDVSSSRDNSYLQSFVDGREFHSPPLNVNMFSDSCRHQSSSTTEPHHAATAAVSSPRDTFNDVQLFSEVSLSSLFDLASTNQVYSGQGHCSAKTESEPSFASVADEYFLPSCQYATPVTNPSSTTLTHSTPNSSSCMYTNGYGRNHFDLLESLDDCAFTSIDNLASYSH